LPTTADVLPDTSGSAFVNVPTPFAQRADLDGHIGSGSTGFGAESANVVGSAISHAI
jgi:hypothetical protein